MNFPTWVLFKSCRLIAVMIAGILWFRKVRNVEKRAGERGRGRERRASKNKRGRRMIQTREKKRGREKRTEQDK